MNCTSAAAEPSIAPFKTGKGQRVSFCVALHGPYSLPVWIRMALTLFVQRFPVFAQLFFQERILLLP